MERFTYQERDALTTEFVEAIKNKHVANYSLSDQNAFAVGYLSSFIATLAEDPEIFSKIKSRINIAKEAV